MINIRIDISEERCALCESAFSDGDIFCQTSSGKHFCRSCVGRGGGFKNGERQYVMYYAENGTGSLILENLTFPELDSGIYALRRIEKYLVIDSIKEDSSSAQLFLKETGSDGFIIEKHNEMAVLLFPEPSVLNQYDFVDQRAEYSDIVGRFERFARCSNIQYIMNCEDQIIGMSNMHMQMIRRQLFAVVCKDDTGLNIAQLEKRCSNNISRRVQRFLDEVPPQVMHSYCDGRIQGQGKPLKAAVYQIYRYMQQVASGKAFTALNWVLTTPSGSGKTEFFRAIRDFFEIHNIPIPVVQIDLSQITEEGFKGANASSIPKRILQEKPEGKGIGICFLDEADKKCVPCYGSKGGNINAAIQSNLLTLIEGSKMKVEVDDAHYDFDSSKTMFVLMGAFQSVRHHKSHKETKRAGFLSEISDTEKTAETKKISDEFYDDITLQDMIDYGMQEELAGRMSQVINFHRLSRKDMIILLRSKVKEISEELGFTIRFAKSAETDFLDIAFGSLGIRYPMNIIREVAQNTVADVFFEGRFDSHFDDVVIDSLTAAHIRRRNKAGRSTKKAAVQHSSP